MHTIQRATAADLDQIALLFDLYRQFYGRAADRAGAAQFLSARLQAAESVILMAYAEGEAQGFVQLYPSFSSVSMARTYVLNDLFVLPTARRQGVAKRLLQAAADFARGEGAVRLGLSTAQTNVAAQNLYRVLGWQRDEVFWHYQLSLS